LVAPSGADLLLPHSDEQVDSGILSPAPVKAPDPWATPSIVPPPPEGPPVLAVEPGPEGPAKAPAEAEGVVADGADAVALKAPRAESRPLPRWALAAAPLALVLAFGASRLFSRPAAAPPRPDVAEASASAPPAEPPAAPASASAEAPSPPPEPEAPAAAATADAAPAPSASEATVAAPPPRREPMPSRDATPKGDDEGGSKASALPRPPAPAVASTFDRDAAAGAVGSALANAQSCVPAGMGGVARVSITFAPSGRATQATVEGPPFAGTPAGGCIALRARSATVPPFSGGPVTVHKSVRF
jgi:hypothetical protein